MSRYYKDLCAVKKKKKCNIVILLKKIWEQFWGIHSVCMDFAKKKTVELMAYRF